MDAHYYVNVGGTTSGPASERQVLAAIRRGKIPREADVCAVGASEWQRIEHVEPFAAAFRPVEPKAEIGRPFAPLSAPSSGAAIVAAPLAAAAATSPPVVATTPTPASSPTTPLGPRSALAVPSASAARSSVASGAPIVIDRRTLIIGAVAVVGLCIVSCLAGGLVMGGGGSTAAATEPVAVAPAPLPAVPAASAVPVTAAAPPVPAPAPVRSAADLIVGTWTRPGGSPETYETDGSFRFGDARAGTYSISGTAAAATLVTTTAIGATTWEVTFPDADSMICSGIAYRRATIVAPSAPAVTAVEVWRATPFADRAAELAAWRAISLDDQLHATGRCAEPPSSRGGLVCTLVAERTERYSVEVDDDAAERAAYAALSASERGACDRALALVRERSAAAARAGADSETAAALRGTVRVAEVRCHTPARTPLEW